MPYKDKEFGRQHKREYEKSHRDEANARSRKFYANHRDNVLTYFKDKYAKEQDKYTESHRMKRYGISNAEYDEMYSTQDGKCAICGRHQSELSQRLCIDHCHETGFVRGLLCKKCNSAIGLFSDNLKLLQNAIKYLEVNHVA